MLRWGRSNAKHNLEHHPVRHGHGRLSADNGAVVKCVGCGEEIEGDYWAMLNGPWHLDGDCGNLYRRFLARECEAAVLAAQADPRVWERLARFIEENGDA